MVTDIDIAKRILIKDFDHFVDRTQFGLKLDENNEYDAVRVYHGILWNDVSFNPNCIGTLNLV